MRKVGLLLAVCFATVFASVQAQTADEILDTYFENVGGKDAWRAIEGIRMTATIKQGGMEIPLEIIQLKDGRQMDFVLFSGKNHEARCF